MFEIAKKEIIKTGKKLYKKGFAAGGSGNISIKFEDKILISPSGFNLGDLELDNIVIIDTKGNLIDGNYKPSSEKNMHIEIYKVRPDVSAIIHAHLPKATAFAVAGIPLSKPILAEPVVFLGDIPVVEYATPSSDKLANQVSKSFLDNDAVLMANHGAAVVGKTLKEALHKIETLEFYSEVLLWTKVLGKANELSSDNVKELLDMRKQMFNK